VVLFAAAFQWFAFGERSRTKPTDEPTVTTPVPSMFCAILATLVSVKSHTMPARPTKNAVGLTSAETLMVMVWVGP
jgi:hypothetical protein